MVKVFQSRLSCFFKGPGVTDTPYNRLDKPSSVGKLLRNLEVRFVDDDGNDVPPGESGELWVRYAISLVFMPHCIYPYLDRF